MVEISANNNMHQCRKCRGLTHVSLKECRFCKAPINRGKWASLVKKKVSSQVPYALPYARWNTRFCLPSRGLSSELLRLTRPLVVLSSVSEIFLHLGLVLKSWPALPYLFPCESCPPMVDSTSHACNSLSSWDFPFAFSRTFDSLSSAEVDVITTPGPNRSLARIQDELFGYDCWLPAVNQSFPHKRHS